MAGRVGFLAIAGRACAAALLLALLAAALPAHAQTTAERRVALVVGNADYPRAPLVNPINDAADLAAALRRLGFEVIERRNRGSDELKRDLIEFQDKLGPGAVGLFYFAGHGVQAGRGLNYLLPVGVDYRRERDAEVFGLEAGSVMRRMEESGATLNIVILDACRDSPLPPEGRSSASRGLGRMEAPSGSLIAFATSPGSTADENRGGRNGLYTQHLLRAIETPGLRLEDVFKQVRRDVERASNRRQSPEEISKLTSDFYFQRAQAIAVPAPLPRTPAPGQAGSVSLEDLQREEATRQQWAQWQQRMQADYEQVASFSGSADLQVKAWERFLGAWSQDNPLSADDERLRQQAQARMEQARREAQRTAAVVSERDGVPRPVATGDAMVAGMVFKDCAECPELVVVPAGSFLMGSPASEPGRYSNEGPQRRVTVQSFAAGRYEVTFAQWDACRADRSCTRRPEDDGKGRGSLPVHSVSWDDAQQYANWLSRKTGKRYRLLSEAEWEYAARAGTSTPFHTGQTINPSQANFHGDYTYNGSAKGENRQRTVPAGQFEPNAFGLYDMHGSVWEWVQDVWHDDYNGAPSDGSAWVTGGNQLSRVVRGGGWSSEPQFLRSAIRSWSPPDIRGTKRGFRIARTL